MDYDSPMEWAHEQIRLTDSRSQANVQRAHALLRQTYWGVRRPINAVEKMIANSLCFWMIDRDSIIGFGRAVTDYAVFTWIADVVIDGAYRRRGLGKWMMSCMLEHPDLAGTQFVLQTRDAHALYERFGFAQSSKLMSTAVSGL